MANFNSQSIFMGTVINVAFRTKARLLRFLLLVIISLQFGASFETDAYFIAQSILLIFFALGDGVVNLSFIPVFVDYKKNKSEQEAWNLANATFTFLCIGLLIVSAAIFIFAPVLAKILAPGFSEKALDVTTILIRTVSPAPMIAGMSYIPAAIFYSHRSFIAPAITSLFYAGGGIMMALFLADAFGIQCIPAGSVAGLGLQTVVLIWLLKKKSAQFKFSWDLKHPGVTRVKSLGGRRLLAFILGRVDLMVDRVFASVLGVGSVSYLSYGQRASEIPLAVLGTTLGRVFMPVVSGYASEGNNDELRGFLSKGLRGVGFVVIPLAVLFAILRVPIIEALFQRGAFMADDTTLTATVFLYYNLGLVAVSFNTILLTIFFALQDAATPLKIVLVSTPLNVVCDAVFVLVFGLGGIALATSVMVTVKMVYLLKELRKKIGHLDGRRTVKALSKICLASVIMGVFGWWLSGSYCTAWLPGENLLRLSVLVVLSTMAYLAACFALRVKELGIVFRLIKRKVLRDK